MPNSLRDEVEALANAYALASVKKVGPCVVANELRQILGRHPPADGEGVPRGLLAERQTCQREQGCICAPNNCPWRAEGV